MEEKTNKNSYNWDIIKFALSFEQFTRKHLIVIRKVAVNCTSILERTI